MINPTISAFRCLNQQRGGYNHAVFSRIRLHRLPDQKHLYLSIMKTLKAFSLLILLLSVAAPGCKPKQKTASPAPHASDPGIEAGPKVYGRVTHDYRASGCGTAVMLTDSASQAQIILLPVDTLGVLDVEGLQISFRYRPLKRKNPLGCRTGFPAKLTDIEKLRR